MMKNAASLVFFVSAGGIVSNLCSVAGVYNMYNHYTGENEKE
jgi:hypothetical protein